MIKDNSKFLFNKYIIIFVVVLVFSVIGATYAYFAVSGSNNNTIGGDAAVVSLNLRVNRILPYDNADSNGVIVPQLANSALQSALRNGCVDSNKNVVCQVYRINIKNEGTASVILDGSIYFFSDINARADISAKMPNLKWQLVESFDEANISNSVLGNNTSNNAVSSGSVFSDDLFLESNQEEIYYMIVWVNEIRNEQIDFDNNYCGDIEFVASNGNGVTASFVGY